MKQLQAEDFLDKIVMFQIDRPMFSLHPRFDMEYKLNYGFIPSQLAGDVEDMDIYLVGVEIPLKKDTQYVGECIAVIKRANDVEDKLVVRLLSDGKDYNETEIRELTNFQEKYFDTSIVTRYNNIQKS